jgi:hypothetical protein
MRTKCSSPRQDCRAQMADWPRLQWPRAGAAAAQPCHQRRQRIGRAEPGGLPMFQHLRDIRRIAGQDRPTGAEIEKKLQGQDSGTEFLQRLKRRRDEQDGGGENVFAERGFSLPGNDTDIRHRSGPRLNRPVTVGADEQEGEVRQLLCSLDHDVQALLWFIRPG